MNYYRFDVNIIKGDLRQIYVRRSIL